MNIKNKGFTLVETMIVVAVIGVLATIALPAYQDYNIKAQVAEGLSLASGQKSAIAEYYSNYGELPSNNDLGFEGASGNYIRDVDINNGTVLSFFGNDANELLFKTENTINGMPPFIGIFPEKVNPDGSIDDEPKEKGVLPWTCISSLQQKYLPNGCINVALIDNAGGNNGGDIDSDNPYDYPLVEPNEDNLYSCEWGEKGCADTPEDLGCFQMSNGEWAWWEEVPMYGGGTIKQKGSCEQDNDNGYWYKPFV